MVLVLQLQIARMDPSIYNHTYYLSFESSPRSEEGGDDQQMMPELLNEAFSVKATRQKP
jgi:hypothetical protein